MRVCAAALFIILLGSCTNTPEESGALEVVAFSPPEGTKIDCNTIIKYQIKYQITDPKSDGTRTLLAKNNQTTDKNYSITDTSGEITDQISGQDFYTNTLGIKCRKGKVPFSFQFSLNLANGARIDSKTYLFDEVPGTSCLANTGFC